MQFAVIIRALAVLAAVFLWAPSGIAQLAAPAPVAVAVPDLDAIGRSLDDIETSLRQPTLTGRALTDLARTLTPLRDQIRSRLAQLQPRLDGVDRRLAQIGAPPAEGTAEAPAIAAERERLNRERTELDSQIKQAKLLDIRAEQLAERLRERRRTLLTEQLFERSASLFDPFFWGDAATGTAQAARNFATLMQDWAGFATASGGLARLIIAGLILIAFAGFVALFLRWVRRELATLPPPVTRLGLAIGALGVLARDALTVPLPLFAAIEIIAGVGLMPEAIENLALGIAFGIAVAAFGRGVAAAVLRTDAPTHRLVSLDDLTAKSLRTHCTTGARALGAAIILLCLAKASTAPIAVVNAIEMVFSLAIAALLIHLLLPKRTAAPAAPSRLPWVRAVGWIIAAAILIALAFGQATLAFFIAERLVSMLAIAGALYLLLVATDTLFTRGLSPDLPRGRSIAATLGIRRLALVGVLSSAVIRILLVLFALLLVMSPWEGSAADFVDALQGFALGFKIGEFTIPFGAVFGAVFLMVLILLFTHLLQRWLAMRLLPRTTFEPSLQLSIATIVGYVGVIAAVVLALGQIGIDLQKIALIAGALSIGIGFGLQSIVSNFVSGLILLAERPIRVGDQIVVKGEEGKVRRISVRATELEMPDQASLIIPNSDLITGAVKNWSRPDSLGRVIIRVNVGYDSDAEQVRAILSDCVSEHPQVRRTPAPAIQLASLSDNALQFEVYAVVANFANTGAIRSDINFAILRRFREVGIELAYPQREVRHVNEAPARAPRRKPAPPQPRDV